MKARTNIASIKGIFMLVMVAIVIAIGGCSKKPDIAPKSQPKPMIALGTYEIIEDQGSVNGDTVYYTRTLNACGLAARYTFTKDSVKLSSSCTPTQAAHYSYNSDTKILTLTNSNGSTTILIEDLTATGFIWNAIATKSDNARYTLQLVK